jgi:hypothetical protein
MHKVDRHPELILLLLNSFISWMQRFTNKPYQRVRTSAVSVRRGGGGGGRGGTGRGGRGDVELELGEGEEVMF